MTGDAKVPGISVVVPVYNSEGSLAELVRPLEAPLADAWEIILVNEGNHVRGLPEPVRLDRHFSS